MRTPSLLLLLLLTGCSFIGSLFGKGAPTARLRSLAVVAGPAANQGLATAIDVVFVYEQNVVPILPGSAPAWFTAKETGFTNTLGTAVDIVSLQVPAPFRLESVELPARLKHAIRVIAYANYVGVAGRAPINLTNFRKVTLTLLPDGIETDGT